MYWQLAFMEKYETESLTTFSDQDAWPVLLDEFVDDYRADNTRNAANAL